jgi:hypothetical protein
MPRIPLGSASGARRCRRTEAQDVGANRLILVTTKSSALWKAELYARVPWATDRDQLLVQLPGKKVAEADGTTRHYRGDSRGTPSPSGPYL